MLYFFKKDRKVKVRRTTVIYYQKSVRYFEGCDSNVCFISKQMTDLGLGAFDSKAPEKEKATDLLVLLRN